MTEILAVRREQEVFDAEAFDEAMARVGGNHDGVVVAKAFLRSLVE